MNYIIDLNTITKSYFNEVILDEISLQIKPGTFNALLGHNGAGKSTLLGILAGQEYADTCKGTILGQIYNSDYGVLKNDIAFVSENINFEVNVKLSNFFKSYAKAFRYWDQDFFTDLIKIKGFDLSREFGQFSRGQKMQIALIASLARKPKILMVDEITSVLDVYARKYYINLLQDFVRKGGTVIMTTNIITEIQFIADNAILIHDRKLLFNKTIQEINSDLVKLRKTPHQKNHPIFSELDVYWIGTNSDFSDSYICEKNKALPYDLDESIYDRRKISLEEAFMFYVSTSKRSGL